MSLPPKLVLQASLLGAASLIVASTFVKCYGLYLILSSLMLFALCLYVARYYRRP